MSSHRSRSRTQLWTGSEKIGRGNTSPSGSGIAPSFGDMLVACVDDRNKNVSGQVDWSMWTVSSDNDDDDPLTTSGVLSFDLGEEWKNWCAEDPDWESDVSAKDGESGLVLPEIWSKCWKGPSGTRIGPFCISANKRNVFSKYGLYSELFFLLYGERVE